LDFENREQVEAEIDEISKANLDEFGKLSLNLTPFLIGSS